MLPRVLLPICSTVCRNELFLYNASEVWSLNTLFLQAPHGADCIAASRPERNGAVASSRVERFPVGEKINWQIGEMVGAGAFGRVYLGLNNDTGQLMAVKQVRMIQTWQQCVLPAELKVEGWQAQWLTCA